MFVQRILGIWPCWVGGRWQDVRVTARSYDIWRVPSPRSLYMVELYCSSGDSGHRVWVEVRVRSAVEVETAVCTHPPSQYADSLRVSVWMLT